MLLFDKKIKKQLDIALLGLDDDESAWITYEEYTLIKTRIEDAIRDYDLKVTIYKNNLYPDYYPIPFDLNNTLIQEINTAINTDNTNGSSEECKRFLTVYNTIITIDDIHYGSFYNYEYESEEKAPIHDYYPSNIKVEDSQDKADYNIFLNEDIEAYLRALSQIMVIKPNIIGLNSTKGMASDRIQASLQSYCLANGIRLINYHEILPENAEKEKKLIDIARNDIGLENFINFRNIKFYKNPDIDKETIELSQGQIIQEIIHQAENSYDPNNTFRDIFITASTGAGKSIMFQIPAVYLAKNIIN